MGVPSWCAMDLARGLPAAERQGGSDSLGTQVAVGPSCSRTRLRVMGMLCGSRIKGGAWDRGTTRLAIFYPRPKRASIMLPDERRVHKDASWPRQSGHPGIGRPIDPEASALGAEQGEAIPGLCGPLGFSAERLTRNPRPTTLTRGPNHNKARWTRTLPPSELRFQRVFELIHEHSTHDRSPSDDFPLQPSRFSLPIKLLAGRHRRRDHVGPRRFAAEKSTTLTLACGDATLARQGSRLLDSHEDDGAPGIKATISADLSFPRFSIPRVSTRPPRRRTCRRSRPISRPPAVRSPPLHAQPVRRSDRTGDRVRPSRPPSRRHRRARDPPRRR